MPLREDRDGGGEWQSKGGERSGGKGNDRGGDKGGGDRGYGDRSGGKGDDRFGGKGQRGPKGGGGGWKGDRDRYQRDDQDRDGGKRREGKGRKGGNDDYRSGGGGGGWNNRGEQRDRRRDGGWGGGGDGGYGGSGGYGGYGSYGGGGATDPAVDDFGDNAGNDEAVLATEVPEKPVRTPLWTEYADVDGMPYYYNSRTGLCQWDRPPELDPPKKSSLGSLSQERGTGFSGFADQGSMQDRGGRDNFGRGRDGGGGYRDRDGDRDDRRRGDGGRDGGGKDGGRGGRGGGGDKGGGRRRGGGKGGGGAGGAQESDFGPPGCNLFVFHLPDDWTDDDLHEYFAPHGNVISAKVMKELGSGRSRGFGFVSYEDRVSAATAVKKMQGYKILGKRLKVEFKKGEGEDNPLEDEDGGAPKKSYADDERLIGYLRAISAKNVVQSLKASEGEGGGADDLGLLPDDDAGD